MFEKTGRLYLLSNRNNFKNILNFLFAFDKPPCFEILFINITGK